MPNNNLLNAVYKMAIMKILTSLLLQACTFQNCGKERVKGLNKPITK